MRAALLALALPLVGCGLMQSMMTKSVDQTAGAEVIALEGEQKVKRLGADGNSFSVALKVGERLKTADLVLGSDDEQSRLWLKLAEGSAARFEEADFVLRAPLGEDTDEFMATVEMGRVLLSLKGSAEHRFVFIDTNKNKITAKGPALIYLVVDDEKMDAFVKEGAVVMENTRAELRLEIPAGEGHRIGEEAKAEAIEIPADLDWTITPKAGEKS